MVQTPSQLPKIVAVFGALAACTSEAAGLYACATSGNEVQSPTAAVSSAARVGEDVGWPTFGRDYAETRRASLGQIRATKVHGLRLAWKFMSGRYGKFEATPIVVHRTMYLTLPPDGTVVALDATNGNVKWQYKPRLEPVRLCCGPVNRGVAYDNQTVFVATLDDRLVALDARTGVQRWQARVADPTAGYSETIAPLAWNGMVFVGVSGGDVGIRGSLTAFSEASGNQLWRWWSVSNGWEGRFAPSFYRNISKEKAIANRFHDSWRRGGGSIWMTPALDPTRSTIYISVGNPFPVVNDASRPGDNLYTDSVVALEAKTGKMHWYYQEVPHDRWDYDAASPPVLFDLPVSSTSRLAALGEAGKTGWFYVLNRDTGALIRKSQAFVPQWHMFTLPAVHGALTEPGGGGGAVAPVAFDASSGQVFVTVVAQRHFGHATDPYWLAIDPARYGLTAVNVSNGKKTWQRWFPPSSSIAQQNNATAGACVADDVVFVGEESTGRFDAFDVKTGALLWQFQTTAGQPGAGAARSAIEEIHDWLAPVKHSLLREAQAVASSHIHSSPVVYMVGGVEYVAIGGDAFYRMGDSGGDTMYAFTLQQ